MLEQNARNVCFSYPGKSCGKGPETGRVGNAYENSGVCLWEKVPTLCLLTLTTICNTQRPATLQLPGMGVVKS